MPVPPIAAFRTWWALTKPKWEAEAAAINAVLHAEAQANLTAEWEHRRENGNGWTERVRLDRLARKA